MEKKKLVLISDSTGNLGERMILALTSQYPKDTFQIRIYSFIRKKDDVSTILRSLTSVNPIIFHTVLSTELKEHIGRECHLKKIHHFDLTGPAMTFLETISGLTPEVDPERLHELDTAYEKRISALTFSVEHDDGLGTKSLTEADIVLLGVSRTSKTPTSIFLANQGYKVANIPLVKNIDVISKIPNLESLKTIGLVIDPQKLQDIRIKRATAEKIPGSGYVDLDEIRQEIKEAKVLFNKLKCPVIDVTNHAVEETAALILKALGKR